MKKHAKNILALQYAGGGRQALGILALQAWDAACGWVDAGNKNRLRPSLAPASC
jgi:hypothetical protein